MRNILKLFFQLLFLFTISVQAQSKNDLQKWHTTLRYANSDSIAFKSLIEITWLHIYDDKIDSAIIYAGKAKKMLSKLSKPSYKVNSIETFANIEYAQGNYAKALELFIDAKNILKKNNDRFNEAFALMNIGIQITDLEDYTTAIKYLKESEEIFHQLKKHKSREYVLNKLGLCYLELQKNDSALFYFQKAYAIGLENNSNMSNSLYGLGKVHQNLKNYAISKSYFKKVEHLILKDKVGSETKKQLFEGLAKTYETQKNKDSAVYYYSKVIEVIDIGSDKYTLKSYRKLAEYFEDKNNDLSASYYSKYVQLADSLYNSRTTKKMQALILQDIENQKKAKEMERIAEENRSHMLQYAAIALIILSFAILLILLTHSIIINERWVKVLGILGLLLFFEFINLIIHPYLGHLTHHSPILMLMGMVVIAAIIIPLHHKIEHWATHKLIEKNRTVRLKMAKKTIEKYSDNQE